MTATFKNRQRVTVTSGGGNAETATIVRPDRQLVGWFIVRFDDGHKICVFATSLKAA